MKMQILAILHKSIYTTVQSATLL